MNKKNIFITGGHFTPAKAVVDELNKTGKFNIFYVGRKNALEGDSAVSLEYQEMTIRPGVRFLKIITGRPQRRFTNKTIPSLLKIPMGLLQSLWWILRFQPRVVVTFGGYVAVPVATVAWLFDIPVIDHEQVLVFGSSIKYLSLLSQKVLVSFEHLVTDTTQEKYQFVGNPLRSEVFNSKLSLDTAKMSALKKKLKLPLIYITGGNQGSHKINQVFYDCLERILKDYLVIWQTGDSQEFRDFDKITDKIAYLPQNLRERIVLKKFVKGDEIGSVYDLADLVVGRSGANTVWEIGALGKNAIFVPITWVHDAEQLKNAQVLERVGSALVLEEKDLNIENLEKTIAFWKKNQKKMLEAAKKTKKMFPTDAASRIAVIVEKTAE